MILKVLNEPETFTIIPRNREDQQRSNGGEKRMEDSQKLRKYPAHFMPINVKSDSIAMPTEKRQL
jgi:hypothetical protein